jgi:hypothetical protein
MPSLRILVGCEDVLTLHNLLASLKELWSRGTLGPERVLLYPSQELCYKPH